MVINFEEYTGMKENFSFLFFFLFLYIYRIILLYRDIILPKLRKIRKGGEMLRLCKKKLIKLLFFTSNNVSFLFNETYDILISKIFKNFFEAKSINVAAFIY